LQIFINKNIERYVIDLRKILIIEDNLVELQTNTDELLSNGYNAMKASNTAKAEDIITKENEKNEPFDCIIIDLNMTNEYLSKELKIKTHGGSLTGWVWLYDNRLIIKDTKVIIYSEFVNELEDNIKRADEEEREYFNKATLISKADAVDGSELLSIEVKKVFNDI
jgi:CheY-like chemotaxis protein